MKKLISEESMASIVGQMMAHRANAIKKKYSVLQFVETYHRAFLVDAMITALATEPMSISYRNIWIHVYKELMKRPSRITFSVSKTNLNGWDFRISMMSRINKFEYTFNFVLPEMQALEFIVSVAVSMSLYATGLNINADAVDLDKYDALVARMIKTITLDDNTLVFHMTPTLCGIHNKVINGKTLTVVTSPLPL